MAVTDEQIGKRLWQDAKAQALGTANLAGHGANQKALTPEEELLLWNEQAKGWTVEKELAMLAAGKTPAQVGYEKYPRRRKLIESGERALDKGLQFKYAADMARKADPMWSVPVPAGAQPLPPIGEATPEPEAPAAPYVAEIPPPLPQTESPEMMPPAPPVPPMLGG